MTHPAGDAGSVTSPDDRAAALAEVLHAMSDVRRVILTTHVNADGDGTGCQAALLEFFRERGVEAWVVNPTPFPDPYRFLLAEPERVLPAGSDDANLRCLSADLCVVIDTGETSRIGRVKPMVEHLPKVVIDHHPPGEDAIEGVAVRDPEAAAAGELVFQLLEMAGGPWTRPVVEGLYVAILTDTGSFRFSNATPSAFRIAAELVARGAPPDELHKQAYGSHPLRRFHLLRHALATLDVSPDGRVAWMVVPREAFRDLECGSDDIEGLVDVPREVEGVEVGFLLRELEDGGTKVSFRANGEVDVNQLARRFGGGGHVKASGAFIQDPVDRVLPRVVAAAREAVEKELGRPDFAASRDGTVEGGGA